MPISTDAPRCRRQSSTLSLPPFSLLLLLPLLDVFHVLVRPSGGGHGSGGGDVIGLGGAFVVRRRAVA